MTDRAELIRQAKDRATDLLSLGDIHGAVSSMTRDMTHINAAYIPEPTTPNMRGLMALISNDLAAAQQFIDDYSEEPL